jgi:lysyl-tRNA synthetase, class II
MSIPEFNEIIEQNDQTAARKNNLDKLRELVGNVYPNKFARTAISGKEDTITSLKSFEKINEIVSKIEAFEKNTDEFKAAKEAINAELKELGTVRTSGRLTTPPRLMGKASFVHLSDGKNRIQIYVRRDDVKGVVNDGKDSEINGWEIFQCLDHGDFVGVEGFLFLTNTGELSIHVEKLQFLSKAMLPMPDKMHGIEDAEIKQRRRYLDLIGSSLAVEHEGLTTREVFERRAKVIRSIRNFLEDDGYIEVETPMLSPKATGAAARPFATHHNALDIPLYARIAPELYLKRLTVGGFEKVYELNRNFRNEGISTRHNPEFTMLEFYCAYMDVNGMMNFAEELLQKAVLNATGNLKVTYGENEIDFGKFERLTMVEAIVSKMPKLLKELNWHDNDDIKHLKEKINEKSNAKIVHELWTFIQNNLSQNENGEFYLGEKTDVDLIETKGQEIKNKYKNIVDDSSEVDKSILALFEDFIEEKLIQPTFIIDYPKSISPLSKASPTNPNIAERFELFINGMECANGFSELNDPFEQYLRFADQMNEREKGDDEAMVLDEDYIRALSYGMPPAAGIGIGIDRLVMLLTNRQSIRDVILFPHMRPERRDTETLGHGDEEK